MPVGFQSFDQFGKLQFDSSMLTYTCRKTGTVAGVAGNNRNITSKFSVPRDGVSANALCAAYVPGGYIVAGQGGGNFLSDAPPGTILEYFWFDRSGEIPSAGFGLEVRNETSQVTFSSNIPVMRIVSLLAKQGSTGYGWYYDEPTSFTSSGKKLAWSSGAYSGTSFLFGNNLWCGLQEEIGNESEVCDSIHGWNGRGVNILYGAKSENAGQTVTTADLDHDSGIAQYGGQNQSRSVVLADAEDKSWDIPLKLFVVDVTNIPVGVTYF